jgi:hypothetical protein
MTIVIVSLPCLCGFPGFPVLPLCRHLPRARPHMPCDVMGTGSYVINRQPEVCGLGVRRGDLIWSARGHWLSFSRCWNERDRDGGEVYSRTFLSHTFGLPTPV